MAEESPWEHGGAGSDTASTEETDRVRRREQGDSVAAAPAAAGTDARRRWPLGLYRVAGESMAPTYQPGDLLLGWRWGRPRPGRVVVARIQGRPIVKRVVRIDAENLWVEGDNPGRSTDTRHFGSLPVTAVEAVILKVLH